MKTYSFSTPRDMGDLSNQLRRILTEIASDNENLSTLVRNNKKSVSSVTQNLPSIIANGASAAAAASAASSTTSSSSISGAATLSTGQMVMVTLGISASPYSALLGPNWTLFLVSAGSSSDFTFLLPAATGSGQVAVVKKMDANAHNVVVIPKGTDTIDGVNNATKSTLILQYDLVRLADGAAGAWSIF